MKKTTWYNYSALALLSFALNFCFTFQLSNLTVLLKFSGASDTLLPLFWLIPPFTGLIIQPIIGYLSDESVTAFGKRKPYIISWGIFAAISFLVLPFCHSLFFILLTTFFIDCSLNGSGEGLRAIVADTFAGKEKTKAFAIFAFFAGLGGVFGAYLPNFIQKILPQGQHFSRLFILPTNLIWAYLCAGTMFAAIILFCTKAIQERPATSPLLTFKLFLVLIKNFFSNIKIITQLKKSHPVFLKILFIHGLSWLALFIFWLYFSICIAQDMFHLPKELSADNRLYKKIMYDVSLKTSYYFSVYQYVSLIFTMVVFTVSKYIKIEWLHGAALMAGGVGLSLIVLLAKVNLLMMSSILIGIMWGSMIVLPYVIVLKYLPSNKVGFFLGIFNISITLPQIVGGLSLPVIYSVFFQSHANYLLLFAGLLATTSSILWLYLFYEKTAEQPSLTSVVNSVAIQSSTSLSS